MTCSPFQLAANRLNAAKSTGPKTIEGKARSRRNSFKHGLTGAGVALPKEDAEAVQERFDALEGELKPNSVLARILVQRVALFSIRLERCARHEAVSLSEKVRAAESEFDEGRSAEADRLIGYISAEPAPILRRLRRTPEGIDRLISAWGDLRYDLLREGGGFWSESHRDRAENLAGRHYRYDRVSRIRALTAGIGGHPDLLDPADLEHGDIPTRCRDELARLIDSEVEKLKEEKATLDLGSVEADRAEAADRALFDASHAATLARRYEAAAERGMYKALDRIEAIRDRVVAGSPVEADGPEGPEEAQTEPSEAETSPSLPGGSSGSFYQVAPTVEPAAGCRGPNRSEPARVSAARGSGIVRRTANGARAR